MIYRRESNYVVENHPFGTIIPLNATTLIIGTFPTYKDNYKNTFTFYYASKDNLFWKVIEEVYNHRFRFWSGENAVKERIEFFKEEGIGITDILKTCYRDNNSSSDRDLFPIVLTDIFILLEEHISIRKLILTSRTGIVSVLGLLKIYFIQRGLVLKEPVRRNDKVLEGSFTYYGREIQILVPYSTSPLVIQENKVTKEELIKMYRSCLF